MTQTRRDRGRLRGYQQSLLGRIQDPEFIRREVERLRELAAPQEAAVRSQLRDRLFASGRLGAARGGGRTGALFNPETAALEEALAQVDLERVGAARAEEQRLFGNVAGLQGLTQDLLDTELRLRSSPLQAAQLGILARTPAALASGLMAGANTRAQTTLGSGFQLGRSLGGLFGGGGSSSTTGSFAQYPYTDVTTGIG